MKWFLPLFTPLLPSGHFMQGLQEQGFGCSSVVLVPLFNAFLHSLFFSLGHPILGQRTRCGHLPALSADIWILHPLNIAQPQTPGSGRSVLRFLRAVLKQARELAHLPPVSSKVTNHHLWSCKLCEETNISKIQVFSPSPVVSTILPCTLGTHLSNGFKTFQTA